MVASAVNTTGIMVTAVLLLFVLPLSLFIFRSIVRPLGAATKAAQDVAQGNLDVTLDVAGKDEITHLETALNSMVGTLRENIASIGAKSKEAEEKAQAAQVATVEANEAKARAERAKAEGMLAAADKLEGVVERVTSASEELSAQVEQSSKGAEGQSQRVAETATAMEQMTATVIEVASSASKAAETTEIAKGKATDGASVVGEVVKSIGQVQAQALTMKGDMGILGQQAEGIGTIMNVISDIADQTNLLALNAAIEAARAGDAGRGFAVVADEVRKLAEKTMTATREVGEAISGIQKGTAQNIEHVDQAVRAIEQATTLANTSGKALREIVQLVDHASDQVRSIATASEQQSAASEQISRSIEEVNTISTETSQAMHQASQAVGELANQSHVLKRLIEEMQDEGGGGNASAPARAAVRKRA
ncbi:MAG: hypothetical protein A2051_06895 [Desulfovibrionales bacterium GWA2_65_9]|nr:MAG: hypothetical protein A2051_06895 [Desulfovibrionales bacterium GWA2_65_9]